MESKIEELPKFKLVRKWYSSMRPNKPQINKFIKRICLTRSILRGTTTIHTSWWGFKIRISSSRQKMATYLWSGTNPKIPTSKRSTRVISRWDLVTVTSYQVLIRINKTLWDKVFRNIQSQRTQLKNYKVAHRISRVWMQCLSSRILKALLKLRKFNSSSSNFWIIKVVQLTKCFLLRRMSKTKC